MAVTYLFAMPLHSLLVQFLDGHRKPDAAMNGTATKAAHYNEISEQLSSRDGERLICRFAKFRQRLSEDVEKFHGIKNEHGHFLMDYKVMQKRR